LPWSGGAVCYPVPEIAVGRVGPVAVSAIGVRAAIEGDVACAISEASDVASASSDVASAVSVSAVGVRAAIEGDVACAVSEASDVASASSDVASAVEVSTIGVRAAIEAGAPVAKAAPAVDLTAAILGGAVRYLP